MRGTVFLKHCKRFHNVLFNVCEGLVIAKERIFISVFDVFGLAFNLMTQTTGKSQGVSPMLPAEMD